MPRIFISYRRADSRKDVERILAYLSRAFGAGQVFVDLEGLQPGVVFAQQIRDFIRQASIVLVIIGQTWHTATDSDGHRRLDSPDDFVRLEIETALNHPHIRVIPVLVDGADMPRLDDLPSSIQPLVDIHAAVVRDGLGFREDIERLIDVIKKSGASPDVGKLLLNPSLITTNTKVLLQGCRDRLWAARDILGSIAIISVVIVLIYIASSSLESNSALSVIGLVILSLVSGAIGTGSVFIYFNRNGLLQNATTKPQYVETEKIQVNSQPNDETSAEPAPRVFISYKRIPNAMHANYIELGLEIKGIDVFMDVSQQDGAIQFPDRLLHEIERSDIIICILSDQTYHSDWVLKEIQHAHKHTKPMIPIFSESFKDWLRNEAGRDAVMLQLKEKGFLESVNYLEQHQAVQFFDHANQYIRYAIDDLYKIITATSINHQP